MTEIAHGHQTLGHAGTVARHLRLSYHRFEIGAAMLEGVLIVLASVLGSTFYQLAISGHAGDFEVRLGIGLVDALIYTFLAHNWGLYRFPVLLSPARRIGGVILAWACVFLIISMVLFLLKVGAEFSRGAMLIFAVVGLSLLLPFRLALSQLLSRSVVRGNVGGRRAVLVAEQNEVASLGASQLLERFGVEEVGRVILSTAETGMRTLARSGAEIDRAVELARSQQAEEFVVAVRWSSAALLEQVSERLRTSPLPVRLLPDRVVRRVIGRRAPADPAFSVELQRAPLTGTERMLKRAFDLIVASAIIALLLPLLAIVALAIKLDSPGPVIFRQRRKGFDGDPFVIYKFRSMTVLDDGPVIAQAQPNDRRVTRVGRLLRRSSIDELPQLLNVLKGDMSLVGPRPHALAHDSEYGRLIANYAFRHHVRPGITGWAQVNGYRGETWRLEQMKQRVELDLWYIDNWSPWLDLRIMLDTCFELAWSSAY